jgi:hypothetical protein
LENDMRRRDNPEFYRGQLNFGREAPNVSVRIKRSNASGKPSGTGRFFIVVVRSQLKTNLDVTEMVSHRFNTIAEAESLQERVLHSMRENLVDTISKTSGCVNGESVWVSYSTNGSIWYEKEKANA